MTYGMLLLFVPACFILNMSPGPNHILALNHARIQGFRLSVLAGSGRILAFSILITFTAFGLTLIILSSGWLLNVIRTLGGLYLIWIGYKMFRDQPTNLNQGVREVSLGSLVIKEFFLAIGNPKAILIFTAFFPQFINSSEGLLFQFLGLGLIFLTLEWLAIALYALLGIYIARVGSSRSFNRWFSRVCGGLLSASGIGLLIGGFVDSD